MCSHSYVEAKRQAGIGGKEGRIGRDLLKATKLQLGRRNKFWC